MNKMLVFISGICLVLNGCIYESVDNRLEIVNQSDFVISVNGGGDNSFGDVGYYLTQKIEPQQSKRITSFNGWETEIKANTNKKLVIYVFSIDTLKKYMDQLEVKEIVRLRKYNARYAYSKEQLDSLNWKVVFKMQ
jgi:hypothetical protein